MEELILEQQLLTKSATQLMNIKNAKELYSYIGKLIFETTGANYLLLSVHDDRQECIEIKELFGFDSSLISKISQLIGLNLYKIQAKVSDYPEEELKNYTSNRFHPYSGGLHALSGKKIPEIITKVIENFIHLESIYTMGFSWDGKLFGGIAIGFKKDNAIKNMILAEAYINQAAIAIQRKKAEDALRESEARYRFIAANIADVIWIIDIHTFRISYVSPSVIRMRGYTDEEVLKMSFDKNFSKTSFQLIKTFLQDMLVRSKNPTLRNYETSLELEFSRKDRGYVSTDNSITMMYNVSGELISIMGVSRDITSRKAAEKQAEEERKRTEENIKMKNNFYTDMSHELRTPLNSMIGISGLMRTRELSEEKRKKYVDIFWSSSNQLLQLVNDILDSSKYEAGLLTLHKEPFSVNSLLNDIHDFFLINIQVSEKIIDLKLNLQEKEMMLISDKQRLRQVFYNLLTNAIKFTHEGYVEYGYETTEEDQYITFFIRDTGIGISNEMQSRVFERYTPAQEVTQKIYGGTGLGMKITYNLIHFLGGEIELTSEEGKGTEYRFSILKK